MISACRFLTTVSAPARASSRTLSVVSPGISVFGMNVSSIQKSATTGPCTRFLKNLQCYRVAWLLRSVPTGIDRGSLRKIVDRQIPLSFTRLVVCRRRPLETPSRGTPGTVQDDNAQRGVFIVVRAVLANLEQAEVEEEIRHPWYICDPLEASPQRLVHTSFVCP